MIKELPFTQIHTGGEDMVYRVKLQPVGPYETQQKINELVDVVNEQQKQIDKMSCAILDLATPNGENKALESIKAESKTPVDPYAEQRNYDVYVKNRHLIGKLCKFKCGQGCYYGILTNIKRKPHEIPFESNGRAFRTCEPVKPTDSIIYKGGDNE